MACRSAAAPAFDVSEMHVSEAKQIAAFGCAAPGAAPGHESAATLGLAITDVS